MRKMDVLCPSSGSCDGSLGGNTRADGAALMIASPSKSSE